MDDLNKYFYFSLINTLFYKEFLNSSKMKKRKRKTKNSRKKKQLDSEKKKLTGNKKKLD
jgi:hypothetical protein